jgi:O-glycosyl hydrolase
MNKNIMFALVGIALAALLFLVGCTLEENDPVRIIPIVEPYISVQPRSYSFNASDYPGPPTLSIAVSNWRAMDGTISYQWYTFDTMEDYCENGGTEMEGEIGPELVLTNSHIWREAGKIYYFYVVVTNDNQDADGDKTAWVQSDLAIISFYNSRIAPFPEITKYPVNAAYTIGRAASVSPLEVRATVAEGGTLSYKWYTNNEFNITTGTLIEGADTSQYMPIIENLPRGDTYFYVEVINTVGARESSITTIPVKVSMLPGLKAATPRITKQPRSQTILTDKPAPVVLSAFADTNDGGVISYQWYSASAIKTTFLDKDINIVNTKIIDPDEPDYGTTADFTPRISTATARDYFYFVEVTNYNEHVTGAKTATTTSKVVTVKVASSGTRTENMTIDIADPRVHANLLQYIRGYGGMEVAWANFPETTDAETETQYNPDWGLGYNILRIMIVPPGSTQGNYTNHSDIILGRPGAEGGWGGLLPRHRPFYIKNVQIVNKYNGYVLASPWTPPKEWKTNNSINSGGKLIPAYYESFATYLREFCQFMYYQDAPVYAVSIANEPNYSGGYDGCEWDDGKGEPHMKNFFVQVGQFTQGARGYGGGKSIPRVLIVNGESANSPRINDPVLENTTARNAVDFYARHVYGSQTETLWNQYASWVEGSSFQTECWMTEHNINSANALAFFNDSKWDYVWRFLNDIDLVVRLNNENAFVWWASKRFYSFIGDGQSGTTEGNILPRGYGMSHFAKYTNETTRLNFTIRDDGHVSQGSSTNYNIPITKNITSSNVNQSDFNLDGQSAKITAYVKREGDKVREITMVMYTPTTTSNTGGYNLGNIKINMPGNFVIDSAQGHKSTSAAPADIFRPYVPTISSDRKSAYVDLARSQILSVRFVVSEEDE